ncbi:hypothetical protein [Candidatus Poriferisocius sp.]|uniref:hypothetical protein n=1 Tax=Candidatus Poriferisocius sp. TaxID=3101276 RepID=UPI003B590CE7
MDPPKTLVADFHDWYDTEHVPARLRIPGFESAVRYEATGDATRFAVCYFIDDLVALQRDDYKRLKTMPSARTEQMLAAVRGFTRYIAELVADTGHCEPTGDLIVHALDVGPSEAQGLEVRYRAWAGEAATPQGRWKRVRLYRTTGEGAGPEWTHLGLHEVDRSVGDAAASAPIDDLLGQLGAPDGVSAGSGIRASAQFRYRPFRVMSGTDFR